MLYPLSQIRSEFPILQQSVGGKPLVYLDSAASAQKPTCVIEAIQNFYRQDYANIHRGLHALSQRSTERYEHTRDQVRTFLNAASRQEIIFVRGATEGVNLVAQTYGRKNVKRGDRVLISAMEHHSNIVPWQMLCEEAGAQLDVIQMNDRGELRLDDLKEKLDLNPKILALVHVSNSLGTINPVEKIIPLAHARGIPVLLDGAQAVPHMQVDVQALDCDFYVFSGHKMYGPSGIGVLYGKKHLLQEMPPYQGGGEMISSVTFDKTTYAALPGKFEAGTPNIAGTIGLGATLDFIQRVGMDNILEHEHQLLTYGTSELSKLDGIRLIGTASEKAAVLSFAVEGVHPHDVGTILDQEGVAVRAGHHCTQPVMEHFRVPATTRASFAMYNTAEDVDRLIQALVKVREMFA